MKTAVCLAGVLFITVVALAGDSPTVAPLNPTVELEEVVYRYEPANNGAGPMWCSGSTSLVRVGDDLFASGLETLKDVPPLNNCRWTLFTRSSGGWKLSYSDPEGRTREPSPLVAFAEPTAQIFLSANPTRSKGAGGGPAQPSIAVFRKAVDTGPAETLNPVWEGEPPFSEHSYRSFAADSANRELILFQNIGYTHAEWAFRDQTGKWSAQGKLKWPWGAEYDKPQPIRVCYPNVALRDRAVHFCGVSDIVEPYERWREHKKEITGREWDYDFRRLFYTWTPDIRQGQFKDWVELASRDKTAGWISPGDLWIAPDGAAHIVWTERAIDERLRKKFFPTEKQRYEMNYAMVRDGKVVSRRTLAEAGQNGEIPSLARWQVTPDNRLVVFYYVHGRNPAGSVSENRVMELLANGTQSAPVRVPLQHPMSSYFTATVRAGSPPANGIDLLGVRVDRSAGPAMCYARVQLFGER